MVGDSTELTGGEAAAPESLFLIAIEFTTIVIKKVDHTSFLRFVLEPDNFVWYYAVTG